MFRSNLFRWLLSEIFGLIACVAVGLFLGPMLEGSIHNLIIFTGVWGGYGMSRYLAGRYSEKLINERFRE